MGILSSFNIGTHATPSMIGTAGEPGAKKTPRPSEQLRELNKAISELKDASEAKRADLDAQLKAAEQTQKALSRLQHALDDAADLLAIADRQFEHDKATLEAMRSTDLIACWGKTNETVRPSQRFHDYSSAIILKAAVDDYPRVRVILADRLARATEAMTKFEQSHGL